MASSIDKLESTERALAIAVRVLRGGAPDQQLQAFDALIRIATPAGLHHAIAWLGTTSPPLAIAACQRWAQIATPDAVVRVLAGAPAELRVLALQALRDASWSVIEPLTGGDRALVLRAECQAHPQLPLPLLVELVQDGASVPALTALVKRMEVLRVAPPELVPLLPGLRAHAVHQVHALQAVGRARSHERQQLAYLWWEASRLDPDRQGRSPGPDLAAPPPRPR
jgi:hypothetical protein